ncbi:MAG: hypothetical protein IJW76_08710 [Clostridia bacterium]|nr:hypothetical protein [Clostridia bacterium]
MLLKNISKLTALILAFALLLSSCGGKAPTETEGGEEGVQSTSASQTVNIGALDYTELKCEDAGSFDYINFICGESVMAINIPFPESWKLYKTGENTYTIKKYAKELGKVYFGSESEQDDSGTTVYSDTKEKRGIETRYSVNRYGEKGSYSYRRKLVFDYDDEKAERKIVFDIDYTAMKDESVAFMREIINVWEVITLPKYNTLSFESGNGKNTVMILGNSFVSTSRIGNILGDICTPDQISYIDAVSLPNVSIKDYAGSRTFLARIESGEYGMLFMCGLFSNDDVTGLEKIYEACQKSGTVLVLFPAHNEDRKRIKAAQEKYPELVTVDWKEEVEQLIYSGVDKWDMCMKDGPEHSTPLAGYVGASMIYRALFGEMPTKAVTQQVSGVTQGYIKTKLGAYLETGKICGALKSTVYYFTETN